MKKLLSLFFSPFFFTALISLINIFIFLYLSRDENRMAVNALNAGQWEASAIHNQTFIISLIAAAATAFTGIALCERFKNQ